MRGKGRQWCAAPPFSRQSNSRSSGSTPDYSKGVYIRLQVPAASTFKPSWTAPEDGIIFLRGGSGGISSDNPYEPPSAGVQYLKINGYPVPFADTHSQYYVATKDHAYLSVRSFGEYPILKGDTVSINLYGSAYGILYFTFYPYR